MSMLGGPPILSLEPSMVQLCKLYSSFTTTTCFVTVTDPGWSSLVSGSVFSGAVDRIRLPLLLE